MADLSGRTVLCVLAHPDDEALACGGTLARLADAGARVVIVCASRGELGSVSDPALVAGRGLAAARSEELGASARVLGAHEVVQLDHPDGCLKWSDGLERELIDLIGRYRPAAVITFDADGLYWHPDHIGMHERTTSAVAGLGAGAPALYYVSMREGAMRALVDAAHARGGAPDGHGLWGITPDAFGVQAPQPTMRIDVGPWIERKLAAVRCHRTQMGPGSPFAWIDRDGAHRWLGVELFRRAATASVSEAVLERLAESVAHA